MKKKMLLGIGTLAVAALVASVLPWLIIGRATKPHVSIKAYSPVDMDSPDKLKLLRFDMAGRGIRMAKFRLRLVKAGQNTTLGGCVIAEKGEPTPHMTGISGMDPAVPWEADIFLLLERTGQTEKEAGLLKCRGRFRFGGASTFLNEEMAIDRDVKLAGWQQMMSEPELASSREIPVATYYYCRSGLSLGASVDLSGLEEESKKLDGFILVLTAQWE